jgi:putative membrane protein
VSVPLGRLVGSILLSRLGLAVQGVVVALIVTATVAPAAAAAVIGTSAVSIIALLTGLWRRFNGEYNLTVAEAPDGLRLRAGLLETTAETIPKGRVQAMRMVEPLLWRPFGWCRMQLDVAGRQRTEGENRSQSRSLRAVLPVGTRAEARRLLDLILPNAPEDRIPPPSRARMKSPLRFHYLTWSRTQSLVVTTSGRVSRITDWVPIAKVQSVRWVRGPVQRRLRLATIHLDTAGRSVHAAIRDRDAAEADRILADLTVLCRAARQAERRPRAGR